MEAGRRGIVIVDQYTYRGAELPKDCWWDAHMNTVSGEGMAQVGRVDAILRGSYPGTRGNRCILVNAIVPKP